MNLNYQDFTSNDSFQQPSAQNKPFKQSSGDVSSTCDFIMPSQYNAPKRPYRYPAYGEPPVKRPAPTIQLGAGFKWNLEALSLAADAVQNGGKSPVSALNELGIRVMYTVKRQSGPAHNPSFIVAVTVADMSWEGHGSSKRAARAAAAQAALAALAAKAGRPPGGKQRQADFTDDDLSNGDMEFQCADAAIKQTDAPETCRTTSSPHTTTDTPVSTSLFGAPTTTNHKSPINIMYESYPGIIFNCTFGDGTPLDTPDPPVQLSHSMRFKVVCHVKDQTFEGYGSSKKLAKLAAAQAALATLEDGPVAVPSEPKPKSRLPQTLADHVSKLVNEKFNELMKDDIIHSKRKVLAGIVITIDNKIEGAKVIGVTTGTKCISGEHMSVSGRALNDCHAEVAARRALQRHLYRQLAKYASADNPSQPILDSDIEPCPGGGYQLKPSRQVHLYVSTAPCGDGRIFSPHEQGETQPDRHPNRVARGLLRTKIESGEGTIPVKNSTNVVQTWDGVMQGERLLTMSCSDKVAKWCVVGLQGALLSLVLKPVYLHSLVLGSLLHPHHMYRAICGRIENHLSALPPPYRLERPMLARAASTEARSPTKAPSFSVCWYNTDKVPEIINSTTGKLENGQPSLLCKQSMFARWQYIVKRLPSLPQEVDFTMRQNDVPENTLHHSMENMLYCEAKNLCPSYQTAKTKLTEAFDKAKLGRWVKKPLEQDQFVCEILNADPNMLFA